MSENIIAKQNNSSKETDKFLKNVQKTIIDRDISEKKLNKSTGLNIHLPKFNGYYSDIRIFTFRSEFKKIN